MDMQKLHQASSALEAFLGVFRGAKALDEAAKQVLSAYSEVEALEKKKAQLLVERDKIYNEVQNYASRKDDLERQAMIEMDKYRELLDKAMKEHEEQLKMLQQSVDSVRMEAERRKAAIKAEKERAEKEFNELMDRLQKEAAEKRTALEADIMNWRNWLEEAKAAYAEFKSNVIR